MRTTAALCRIPQRFLMFVEYARNAARMAALMKARQIMVYTRRLNWSGQR
ncbi:hypothetical protein ACLB1E_15610 [Escherichia coli]